MKSSFQLSKYIQSCKDQVEQVIDYCLKQPSSISPTLTEAMRYSTLNGGKRFRPVLIYATVEALGAPRSHGDIAACAVELVHSYSLVHDDLPAMDDDDLRRGSPTCHIAFDEATAILAGDALQSLAFEVIASTHLTSHLTSEERIQLITQLAQASGTSGMAGGQALDLAAEGKTLTLDQLEQIHAHKTGSLIRGCVQMGAISAGCKDPAKRLALDDYAKAVGLAFQVQDDILDVIADTDTLGKSQGADIAMNKATYPQILGLEAAKTMAQSLLKEAHDALAPFDERAIALHKLAEYVVNREY